MLGSMSAERGRGRILPTAPGFRVTRVELFYDLVFVFRVPERHRRASEP